MAAAGGGQRSKEAGAALASLRFGISSQELEQPIFLETRALGDFAQPDREILPEVFP